MDLRKIHPRNEIKAFLEKRVRLPRKAHDDVGGDRNLRHGLPHVLQQPCEGRLVIMAVHGAEDRIGTGLERQMQMPRKTRLVPKQREQLVRKLDGFQRAQPQPRKAAKG